MAKPFQIKEKVIDGVRVISLEGDFGDVFLSLRDYFKTILDDEVIIDLSNLTFIRYQGVAALIYFCYRRDDGKAILVRPKGENSKFANLALNDAKIVDHVTVVDNLRQALELLQ